VEPRVELLSLIFRLAGNPEYTRGRVPAYLKDADDHFIAFRDHPAVGLARRLRQERGVSYDACMSMAVHLDLSNNLQARLPFAPWPEGLDERWGATGASNFVTAARQFVKETGFRDFTQKHAALYGTTEKRLRALIEKEAHLEWFGSFFGARPQATFTLVPALFNGGNCYGPHFRSPAGAEELFCILGVWQVDVEGSPEFTPDMLETVVHEFCHSYANPLVDRHLKELQKAGDALFEGVASRMRAQAYGDGSTMLRESMVRACVVRYVLRHSGPEAGKREIEAQKRRGFLWMQELAEALGDYEAHRDRFPTLDAFAPRLVSFFSDYSKDFASKQAALATRQPKLVCIIPASGALNVDPGLKEIRVTFDRPMSDGSWSMCGGGDHFPASGGQAAYDAARTTWVSPVKLKPGWDYEFSLNCESYRGFRSAEGVPLEPVPIHFRTATASAAAGSGSSPR
jgi:hypothetical protein